MFSYNEYKNIINLIKSHLPIMDFSEVTEKTEKFCVLRHDIEFSIDRAYKLAKVEKELGVTSTYTVQVRNNTYNALSEKNITKKTMFIIEASSYQLDYSRVFRSKYA